MVARHFVGEEAVRHVWEQEVHVAYNSSAMVFPLHLLHPQQPRRKLDKLYYPHSREKSIARPDIHYSPLDSVPLAEIVVEVGTAPLTEAVAEVGILGMRYIETAQGAARGKVFSLDPECLQNGG